MDGFINLNKPQGASSHWAMAQVRRLLKVKAGHSGTLDPMASGVLPLCLGKATRLAEYVTDLPKQYRAEITFGKETDSYDATGTVLEQKDASFITAEVLSKALEAFKGDIDQVPPMVSALKHNGQPLYRLAREGREVERPARRVTIYDLLVVASRLGSQDPSVMLDITCSKGTYIRSIAHDLGVSLGTGACLTSLTRLQSGPFYYHDSYTLEQIGEMYQLGDLSFVLPMAYGVPHLPQLLIEGEDRLLRVRHGNDIMLEDDRTLPVCRVEGTKGDLLAIGSLNGGVLNISKVLISE